MMGYIFGQDFIKILIDPEYAEPGNAAQNYAGWKSGLMVHI